jgi:hypothetical protein
MTRMSKLFVSLVLALAAFPPALAIPEPPPDDASTRYPGWYYGDPDDRRRFFFRR